LSVSAIVLPALAAHSLWEGEGLRLFIRNDLVYILHEDEPCWVNHGWMGTSYPERMKELKEEYGYQYTATIGSHYFKLSINKQIIHLHRKLVVVPLGNGESERWLEFYRQFPPYYFKPGVYTLRGEWGVKNPRDVDNLRYDLPVVFIATLIVLPAD